jgi:hypothetical protein
MPDKRDSGEQDQRDALFLRQRQAINNAYGSLQGRQLSQTLAAYTFEEAVDAQIERIEGKSTQIRPNQLDYVENIRNQLVKAVDELKQVPPEKFINVSESDSNVNTSESG